MVSRPSLFFFFFFNDTATTEIYTLSLHDALPICFCPWGGNPWSVARSRCPLISLDRKSTRLNSSHSQISYAVFCLKKKKTTGLLFWRSLSVTRPGSLPGAVAHPAATVPMCLDLPA